LFDLQKQSLIFVKAEESMAMIQKPTYKRI